MTQVEAVSLFVGVAGFIASVAGFGVSIWQIKKTQRAAEAAKAASEAVQVQIAEVMRLVSIEQMCGCTQNLLHLVRAKNWPASAHAAFELRNGLAKLRDLSTREYESDEQEKSQLHNVVRRI